MVQTPSILYILTTSKFASPHNGVHFFDISTSKSGPTQRCFVHFDFEMCFAPQRRALFRHLNFQKWCVAEVLCTFGLQHVLRATTACTFSTPQFLTHFTSKCAPRHNATHFFNINFQKESDPEVFCTFSLRNHSLDISAPAALASLLFNPPKPQNHKKHRVSRLFAHLHLLSSDLFSSDSSPC